MTGPAVASATRVAELPRRSRRFAADRRCAEPGCATLLSIYNGGSRCWVHTPKAAPRLRGRPTGLPGPTDPTEDEEQLRSA